ncbi:putative nucleotidyltransferase [Thermus oshimai JL-2]|uniref:Putative nucleotidyltransferase n=1 Tax=Thermus oshimai JL-2 TaxID=751945 RepID=K7QW45_THEOS|nr:nucleotidyltransferase domain-containing protein [Thermus oshimai]AFV76826.1 putative nucleotidyltransferase [Thermus oshimai JL-2]
MEYPELTPVLQAILEAVPAQKVILFGSRARGNARPESDYDLLVVVPEGVDKVAALRKVYLALASLQKGFAVDVVVAHPKDLERYRKAWMTPYPDALKEGKVLYAA